jgi:hypothetical protein
MKEKARASFAGTMQPAGGTAAQAGPLRIWPSASGVAHLA